MVAALGPGRFYGSCLPRPRYYTDVKFNSERIDPPTSVLDPFLSWANEAHWSMGGLSHKRLRLQGRIEGSVKKLRSDDHEKISASKVSDPPSSGKNDSGSTKRLVSVSPPPVPVASKRKRIIVDDGEEEDEGVEIRVSRRLARKLGDDFDKVASETVTVKENSKDRSRRVDLKTRSRRSEEENGLIVKGKKLKGGNKGKSVREKSPSPLIRSLPRLSKGKSSWLIDL